MSDAERIRQLESDLEAMTAALAQAWDQLVPFLQEAPQQGDTLQDFMPILDAVMAALDAPMGAVYLLPHDDGVGEWRVVPSGAVALRSVQPFLDDLFRLQSAQSAFDVHTASGEITHWMFAPMIADHGIVGALGVGMVNAAREFSAVDTRMMARLTERAAAQVIASRLAASRAREARMLHEMEIAGVIQRSIQPAFVPHISGLEVAAEWRPAARVGGDAWGWVQQAGGKLACFMVDVAGKGLAAALAAASLHAALKMALRLDLRPVEALRSVNTEFYEPYTSAAILATSAVLVIDPETGEVEHASAGHPATLLRLGAEWTRWVAVMPPLGVLPDITASPQRTVLQPGDLVICYSDGLSEVELGDDLWGEVGLLDAIPPLASDVRALINTVIAAADQVRDHRPQQDDQTIMALAFEGRR